MGILSRLAFDGNWSKLFHRPDLNGSVKTLHTHTYTHNRFTALFPGPPGWAGARRELLDFMVQGKINRGRHTNHSARRHSSGLTSAHLHHPPYFWYCPSCCPTNSVKTLMATSAFGLGRRRQSSPQRCYLHRLRTLSKCWRNIILICLIMIIINGNVYGAVLMTVVTARVHPVHLMNADWAPGGRQPSDQANRLGLWVRQ